MEELLARACRVRVHRESEREGEQDAREAARERDGERLGQDLAAERPVGRAEGALDAEVADPLEDRGGHRVGEREPADHEREGAHPGEQRREERGRGAEEGRELARELDVHAGHLREDPARDRVRVLAVAPADGGARVQVGRGQRRGARREQRLEESVLCQPLRPRILDRHDDEPVGRRQHAVEHAHDLERRLLEREPRAHREPA